MVKLDKLEKDFNKAVKSYEAIVADIKTSSERVNIAAQLFAMNEVNKDILVGAAEARDAIKATKADAWDKVVKADVAFTSMKKSVDRAAKVADLKAKLKELS